MQSGAREVRALASMKTRSTEVQMVSCSMKGLRARVSVGEEEQTRMGKGLVSMERVILSLKKSTAAETVDVAVDVAVNAAVGAAVDGAVVYQV